MNDDTATKLEDQEKPNFDFVLPKSADLGNTSTPGRQASPLNIQRMSSSQDKSNTSRKSGRISFKGYLFYLNSIQNSALIFKIA